MKRKYLIIIPVFLCLMWSAPAFALSFSGSDSNNEPTTENRTLLHTISDFQDEKQLLLSKQIELRQVEARGAPSSAEMESLNAKVESLNQELKTLNENPQPDANAIAQKTHQKESLDKQLETAMQKFQDDTTSYNQTIDRLNKDITGIQAEVDKLQELEKTQGISFAIRLGVFLTLVLSLFIARAVTAKMLKRMSGRIPVQREHALIRLNNVVFNILIILTILVGIFSQLISFLPFLAIIGTALAFALRDIISSFIAWFIIGTEQGYRIGDLIQTGKLRGRVLEIHPLLTVIRQTGLRGDTGRILSFPNKYIFEQEVQNFSKLYRFIYVMLDFILDRDSDIDLAKKTLRETILECIGKDHDEAEQSLPDLQSKFSLTSRHIEPQIFIEPDPRGILLRGKYFVRLENRHKSRSEITESFFRKVQKMKNVNLRFVEFGEESKEAIKPDSLNF